MSHSQIRGSRVRQVGSGVTIGPNSKVVGRRVMIGPRTKIGRDVSILADEVRIGGRCEIEDRVRVFWREAPPRKFVLGDCCAVGSDCKMHVREVVCGDYVAIHNHVLINGGSACSIGHNSYVGQNCIINANQPVTIGNGVGIVAYSAIWTHGRFGEAIEGSTIHKVAPVLIGDDVTMWRAIVSPGVRIGRKATVLNGSIVTEDVPEGAVVAGAPARIISDKMTAYRRVSLQEKFVMMNDFVVGFLETSYAEEWTSVGKGTYDVKPRRGGPFRVLVKELLSPEDLEAGGTAIAITTEMPNWPLRNGRFSVFDVSTKSYIKRGTEPEVKLMLFLLDARARFIPSTPALRRSEGAKGAPYLSRKRAKSFSGTLPGGETGP